MLEGVGGGGDICSWIFRAITPTPYSLKEGLCGFVAKSTGVPYIGTAYIILSTANIGTAYIILSTANISTAYIILSSANMGTAYII